VSNLTKLPQPSAGCLPPGVTDQRGLNAFILRFGDATARAASTAALAHTTNGDETRYADRSGTYTKTLKQIAPGVVDPATFVAFRQALGSSDGNTPGTADFENAALMLGDERKLNGPQGAFAGTLVGADSETFGDSVVPVPPAVASKEYATELVELYWASLLRDVPFSEYDSNPVALAAAAELDGLASYAGPRDSSGKVTTKVLFRGGLTTGSPKRRFFAGETDGPYLSQFCIQPTTLGAQPVDQRIASFAANVDYMTNFDTWAAVQNGVQPLIPPEVETQRRFMHNGRAVATFTHSDELYQAYFVAYLAMNTLGIRTNPGNPYLAFKKQQPFGTFGGPDIAATLGYVARAAINAVWYQKWVVHLRHRPESGGGIVHLMKSGIGSVDAKVDPIVLNSEALEQSQQKYGTYLLSQAFPEGSPAHPAYPTGHGTVAGACITVLKFFFDGTATVPNPVMPAADGLSLLPYGGPALTVNGELHKLAHNISFGHGIHAGIHWRSDTDYSLLLGEAVALSFLQDQAFTYNENFSVTLTKMDGTNAVIANM
jgi:hypothetical protein